MKIRYYVTTDNKEPFAKWIRKLQDRKGRAKILVAIQRLGMGLPGKVRPAREGVWELKIDFGPGYRVYFVQSGKDEYLLLNGGTKRTQDADIEQAIEFFDEFKDTKRGK